MDEMNTDAVVDEKLLKHERKKGRRQGVLITLLVVLLVVLPFTLWVFILSFANGFTAKFAKLTSGSDSIINKYVEEKVDLLTSVIDAYYLEEYDKQDLVDGMYKGIMAGLDDPYSVYYTKEEYAELMEDSEGAFEGIGAYLTQNTDTMIISVVRPIEGSPAEKVGILAGDIVVEVDGEDISGQDINLVVSKIRGLSGSTVNIGIAREGESEVLYFDIVRAKVESQSVEGEMLEKNIGYILISEFNDTTYGQFKKKLHSLKQEGMEGLVLDLRSNPGGSVPAVVDIADEFLPEGIVVYTVDKNGNREDFKSDKNVAVDMPLVVIVDGNSASAAEILAGAIKDYEVGTLIGTTTYGKGIVQSILPLGDGTGMKVTMAKYYTPSGNNIHKIGIEPDIVVEWDHDAYLEDGTDNQLEKALEVLKEKM